MQAAGIRPWDGMPSVAVSWSAEELAGGGCLSNSLMMVVNGC